MKLSEKKVQLLYTVLSNLFLQMVTAVCGFILPPLIVQNFGSSVNGLVSSINQFIMYLNLVEAGIGGAAIAALYKPLAEDDKTCVNKILSATRKFYNSSGLYFTVLIALLSLIYPYIVSAQVTRYEASLLVLILGITGAGEFFFIGKYRVLLTADRRSYVLSAVQIIAVISNTFLAVILLRMGCNILVVKFSSSLVFLGRYIPIMLYAKKRYSFLNFKEEPDTDAISQSKNVMVHQIGSLVVRNSPLVLITIFCTLKDASVYSVYAMIFLAIKHIVISFSTGIEAFLGASLSGESLQATRKNFDRYESFFFMLVFIIYTLAAVLCIPFMKIYTRNMTDANYIQPDLVVLFVAVGMFDHLRTPGDKLISAAGHFKQTQWRSLLEAGINLSASIICTLFFGFKGVLLGSCCSYLYRTFDIIFYSSRRIIRSSAVKTLFKIFIYLPAAFIILFVSGRVSYVPQNYLQWFLYALVSGFAYSTVYLLVLLLQIKSSGEGRAG